MKRHSPLKTVATAIVTLSFGVFASTTAEAQSRPSSPLSFKFEGGGAHQSETDMTDTSGGFAVDRWFLNASMDYAWDRRTAIGVSVGGGKSNYEFNSLNEFGGGNPWDKVNDTRLTVSGRFGVGDTGSLMIMPTVRFNGETGASSSDSTTFGLFAAIAWRLNENLTIGPGFGVFTRLEDSVSAFPILAIDWNISDRWNLSTGRGLASSQGPGIRLSYKLNQDWSFGLTGRYEDIEFRLDDTGPAPGGVGRDQALPLVLSAVLTPDSDITLSVFAGVEFNGTLKLKNALDEIVDETGYDAAPLFGAAFEFRF